LGIIVGDQIGAINMACISSAIALALSLDLFKKIKNKKFGTPSILVGQVVEEDIFGRNQ
jgi:hypothetical protein